MTEPGILELAELIEEHTGATGAELECYVFYVCAGFADIMGRKDIGDYFDNRLQDAKDRAQAEGAHWVGEPQPKHPNPAAMSIINAEGR